MQTIYDLDFRLFDSFPDMCFILNKQGRVEDLNISARIKLDLNWRGGESHDFVDLVDELFKESFAYAQLKFDLVYELTGSPTVLNDAIELTTYSGRIVIGSWYGEKKTEINLGGSFHHSRIKLISSQVSTIQPELRGRWDKSRRFQIAWKALERIKPEQWITHRFSLEDASQAYQLLDENPQETIQIIFTY